jgi:hypothetical protein
MSETMTKNARTGLVVLAAIGALLLAITLEIISASPAAAYIATDEKSVSVPENATYVDTGVDIQYGDQVAIDGDPNSRIWSGVWFTGWNGPVGWSNYDCSRKFPLNINGGCSRPYSLIARVGDSSYRYVGSGTVFYYQGNATGRLYLSINDDAVGNGAGAFRATITVDRVPHDGCKLYSATVWNSLCHF